MKTLCLATILSAFFVSNAFASDIGKALGKSDVSHLDLIANNMNILTLIDKIQNGPKNKITTSSDGTENTLTKYSTSKDYRLIIESFYTAPVTSVTDNVCNEKLSELTETISGNSSDLSSLLSMISPITLPTEQAQQVLNDSHLVVYVQAKENSRLSLNCRK